MVFSSVPVYLDPPNWHQPQNDIQGVTSDNPQLPPSLPPPPPSQLGGGGTGSTRPASMAERARVAKLPQPEFALKCPRCESANTKFCYFNNYSLSQPRHFCKTCRRYWTKGGALRNVPVGGGCRRNKRSKGNSRSKSPAVTERQAGSSSSSSAISSSGCTDIIGHPPSMRPQFPLLPPLPHVSEYNSGDIGLNFGGIRPPFSATGGITSGENIYFPMGNGSSGSGAMLSSGLVEQWRLQQAQQFPFLTGLESSSNGLYPLEGEGSYGGELRLKALENRMTQLNTVKMEENQHMNLARNVLVNSGGEQQQYWGGGNAWNGLSGFTSSSTSHLL